jgi:hypothetical protein
MERNSIHLPLQRSIPIPSYEMGKECSIHRGSTNAPKILIVQPERNRLPESLGLDGKIILKFMLKIEEMGGD